MRTTAWFSGGNAAAALALAAIVIAVGFLAYDGPRSYSNTAREISENKGIPWRDRQLQGAFGLQISRDFLTAARALVPPWASYRLEVGPDLQGDPTPVWTAVPSFVDYAMAPRLEAADARWLLCYGCAFARIAGRTAPAWSEGDLIVARLPP